MNKVLITDNCNIVPNQLVSKFNEIIVVQDSATLSTLSEMDDNSRISQLQELNSEINKLITKSYTNEINKLLSLVTTKKLKINHIILANACLESATLIDVIHKHTEFVIDISYDSFTNYLNEYRLVRDTLVKKNVDAYWKSETGKSLILALSEIVLSFNNPNSNNLTLIIEVINALPLTEQFNTARDLVTIIDQARIKISNLDSMMTRNIEGINELTNKDLFLLGEREIDKIMKLVNKRNSLLELSKVCGLANNDYLVVGQNLGKVIPKFNELGLRNTIHYNQLKRIPVVKTGSNANIVFIPSLAGTKENIQKMAYYFSDKFAESLVPEMPTNKRVITKYDDAVTTLNKLINIDEGSQFGFDYETNGEQPYSSKFEMIGYSISNTISAIYIDFRYIKLQNSKEQYNHILELTKQWLDKHASSSSKSKVWVFNYSFEMSVSYKLFGTFYEFWDLVIYRNLNSFHGEWWSLKYTAQYDLRVRSWDDNYDKIINKIKPWLADYVPEGRKGKWVPKNDRKYFLSKVKLDEQLALYYNEIVWLYDNGYNTWFTVIPSELIGGYGLLDSYYTIQASRINQGKYDDRCELTFMDNIRMGSRLTGVFRNEKLFNDYFDLSRKMIAYSTLHLARYYNNCSFHNKLSDLGMTEDDLDKSVDSICHNDFTRSCMNLGIDFSTKLKFGRSFVDYFKNPDYESGINENKLYSLFPEFYDGLNNSINEVGTILSEEYDVITLGDEESDDDDTNEDSCTSVAESVKIRKFDKDNYNTLVNSIVNLLWSNISYDKTDNLSELIIACNIRAKFKSLNSEEIVKLTYDEFSQKKLFNFEGSDCDINILIARLFKYAYITSAGQFKSIYSHGTRYFINECRLLAKLDNKDIANNFDVELANKLLPIKSFSDLANKVSEYKNDKSVIKATISPNVHPKKDFDYAQAKRYLYITNGNLTKEYKDQFAEELYDKLRNLNNVDLNAPGGSIIMASLGSMGKRYLKMTSNYFGGTYSENLRNMSVPDENLVSTTEGSIPRSYPNFQINMKRTKRWSSGYHCIYSKSTSKRILCGPEGYGVSYFDISSAEVRSAAYMSGDENLISQFEAGLDPYIQLAKLKYGDNADPKFLKSVRKVFKTALLAQLYGQGAPGLAIRIGSTVQEAEELITMLRNAYPVLFKWIERKQRYGLQNKQVETFLGDKLLLLEEDPGRLKRQGINFCVQGSTAEILAHGFYNIIRNSDKYKMGIQPFITVHDSSINYVPWRNLPYLNEFYYEHFTNYIYKETGIKFLFDTMIGADYTVPCVLGNDGKGGVELTGNDYALLDIVDSIGMDHIITDEDWSGLSRELTNPLHDLVYDFDNASFGKSTVDHTIKFKIKY